MPGVEANVRRSDGTAIHYWIAGRQRVTLVFIHGWAGDGTYWKNQVDYFSPRYRVVALDLGGHGKSTFDRGRWTIKSFAEDVQAVVKALEVQDVILIGHSMGGPVAVAAAHLMPKRVKGVVGVATLQDADSRWNGAQDLIHNLEADFGKTTRNFARFRFSPQADPELVKRVAEDMASESPQVGIQAMKSLLTFDLPAALKKVKQPLICINTDSDPTRVEVNRKYAPQFQVEVIKGSGHFPMLEKPRVFNRVLKRVLTEIEKHKTSNDPER